MIDYFFIAAFIALAFFSRASLYVCAVALLPFSVQLIGFNTSLPDNILSCVILCVGAALLTQVNKSTRWLLFIGGAIQLLSAVSNAYYDFWPPVPPQLLSAFAYFIYISFVPAVVIINTLLLINTTRTAIECRNKNNTTDRCGTSHSYQLLFQNKTRH